MSCLSTYSAFLGNTRDSPNNITAKNSKPIQNEPHWKWPFPKSHQKLSPGNPLDWRKLVSQLDQCEKCRKLPRLLSHSLISPTQANRMAVWEEWIGRLIMPQLRAWLRRMHATYNLYRGHCDHISSSDIDVVYRMACWSKSCDKNQGIASRSGRLVSGTTSRDIEIKPKTMPPILTIERFSRWVRS